MTVNNVSLGVFADLRTSANRLFLPGASDFAGGLNLGQIIKGKVMRQYDGGRYLVSFGGHERVVDSSVPLTSGELIHGRVIGLGERVELQRVYPGEESDTSAPKPGDAATVEISAAATLTQQPLEIGRASCRERV